jgi:hypothetical protein
LEIVPTSTSVCHRARQVAVLIENNAIRTRPFTAIKLSSISHDRELQIWRWDGEWKILVILFGMWVAVAADGLAVLVVAAARVHSVDDVDLRVAVVAADGTIGLACEDVGGWGEGGGKNSGAEEAEEEE